MKVTKFISSGLRLDRWRFKKIIIVSNYVTLLESYDGFKKCITCSGAPCILIVRDCWKKRKNCPYCATWNPESLSFKGLLEWSLAYPFSVQLSDNFKDISRANWSLLKISLPYFNEKILVLVLSIIWLQKRVDLTRKNGLIILKASLIGTDIFSFHADGTRKKKIFNLVSWRGKVLLYFILMSIIQLWIINRETVAIRIKDDVTI